MFRVVLTAYLCFAAFCGPLFCCCALGHATTTQAGEQPSCCGKSSAKTNDDPRSPRDHAPGSCPCRKHHSTMTGAVVAKTDVSSDALGPTFFTDFFAFPASILPEPHDVSSGTKAKFLIGPPASLAGRELLRAYQILRF